MIYECQSFQYSVLKVQKNKTLPVAIRLGDTPVPIPNTTVKTQAADDTWRETARESRWLPDQLTICRCGSIGRAADL